MLIFDWKKEMQQKSDAAELGKAKQLRFKSRSRQKDISPNVSLDKNILTKFEES